MIVVHGKGTFDLETEADLFAAQLSAQLRAARSPLYPEYVTKTFKKLARAAGPPVIRFHDARHTAATLALEAGADVKIVSDELGHSNERITRDTYQHVRVQVHIDAAEKVVALLDPGAAGEARP